MTPPQDDDEAVTFQHPFERQNVTEIAPQLTELRETNPVVKVVLPSGAHAWLVTRYDDVRAVLSTGDFSYAEAANSDSIRFTPFIQRYRTPVSLDGPDHAEVRRLLARSISQDRISAQRHRLENTANRLLDAITDDRNHMDFVNEFSDPFCKQATADLFGLSYLEIDELYSLSTATTSLHSETEQTIDASCHLVERRLHEVIHDKRTNPGDDMLSAFIQQADEFGLDEPRVLGALALLIRAGVGPAMDVMPAGLVNILRYRAAHDLPADDAGKITNITGVVEEVMRLNASAEVLAPKVALRDLELSGVPIARGDAVLPSHASANQDERRFTDATLFKPGRKLNGHMGFGYGIHSCIGQQFARLELMTAYNALLARFPAVRLAVPEEELRLRSPGYHSLELSALPLVW